jgi:hypothetical protein
MWLITKRTNMASMLLFLLLTFCRRKGNCLACEQKTLIIEYYDAHVKSGKYLHPLNSPLFSFILELKKSSGRKRP